MMVIKSSILLIMGVLFFAAAKCPPNEAMQGGIPSGGNIEPNHETFAFIHSGIIAGKWTGISNLGNTCFGNALVQSLYFMPGFPEALRDSLNADMKPFSNAKMAVGFYKIFKAMNASNQNQASLAMSAVKKESQVLNGCQDDPEPWLTQELAVQPILGETIRVFFSNHMITKVSTKNCKLLRQDSELFLTFEHSDISSQGMAKLLMTVSGKEEHSDFRCTPKDERIPSLEKTYVNLSSSLIVRTHYPELNNNMPLLTAGNVSIATQFQVKIPQVVKVPQKGTDLVIQDKNLAFELHAVVVHLGSSLNGGHYITIAKTSANSWHEFDDSQVNPVFLSGNNMSFELSARQPILLFYKVKQL